MKFDNDKFKFSDYFSLLVCFCAIIGLISLSVGPFIVSIILFIIFNPLFLLINLIYIPLLPLVVILWSKFVIEDD